MLKHRNGTRDCGGSVPNAEMSTAICALCVITLPPTLLRQLYQLRFVVFPLVTRRPRSLDLDLSPTSCGNAFYLEALVFRVRADLGADSSRSISQAVD
jgi:hypothetical protein